MEAPHLWGRYDSCSSILLCCGCSSILSTSLHPPWVWGLGQDLDPSFLWKVTFSTILLTFLFLNTEVTEQQDPGHFCIEWLCYDKLGAVIETWGQWEGRGPQDRPGPGTSAAAWKSGHQAPTSFLELLFPAIVSVASWFMDCGGYLQPHSGLGKQGWAGWMHGRWRGISLQRAES